MVDVSHELVVEPRLGGVELHLFLEERPKDETSDALERPAKKGQSSAQATGGWDVDGLSDIPTLVERASIRRLGSG